MTEERLVYLIPAEEGLVFKRTPKGVLLRCVFHAEETPSLIVQATDPNVITGPWHCFGCGRSGQFERLPASEPQRPEIYRLRTG